MADTRMFTIRKACAIYSLILRTLGIPKIYMRTLGYNILISLLPNEILV